MQLFFASNILLKYSSALLGQMIASLFSTFLIACLSIEKIGPVVLNVYNVREKIKTPSQITSMESFLANIFQVLAVVKNPGSAEGLGGQRFSLICNQFHGSCIRARMAVFVLLKVAVF